MTDAPRSGHHSSMLTIEAVIAVLRRPSLWFVALLSLGRLARVGWWRRWPPIPAPDPAYLAWRTQTAYGHVGEPDAYRRAEDLISFLEYCRALRHCT